jgi:hypothetical protein
MTTMTEERGGGTGPGGGSGEAGETGGAGGGGGPGGAGIRALQHEVEALGTVVVGLTAEMSALTTTVERVVELVDTSVVALDSKVERIVDLLETERS